MANSKQRVDAAIRQRDEAIQLLTGLSDKFIEECIRRQEIGPRGNDGFPSSSMGGGHPSRGTISDRTGTHAIIRIHPHRKDPQLQAIEGMLDGLREVSNQAKRVINAGNLIKFIHKKELGRARPVGSGECEACEQYCLGTENDRLRNELCDKCRSAWRRAGQPDRLEWVRERRKKLGLALRPRRVVDSGKARGITAGV